MQQPIKPAGKLFELSEVKRCPVTMSQEARAYINASHHQGRLLPQALEEYFGGIEDVASISIDVAPMQAHLPFHTNSEAVALVVVVNHKYNEDKAHQFLLNALDLREIHSVTMQPLVQARTIAEHLVKRYPHK